jgi:hypothetical protein
MLNFNIAQRMPQTMSDVWRDLERKQALRSLVEPDGTEFVVARQSDGVVIGTFGSSADAAAVIEHARVSKKASLLPG